jgi:hypothetical protein
MIGYQDYRMESTWIAVFFRINCYLILLQKEIFKKVISDVKLLL